MNSKTKTVFTESAFSLKDLMALMSSGSILIVILLSTVGSTLGNKNSLHCRNNLRRLTLAWHLYAEDNGGVFIPAAPGGASGTLQWTGGEWLNLPSTVAAEYQPELSVRKSPLYRYLNDDKVWRCPADFSSAYDPALGRNVPRVRSYSMNCWMGGPEWSASQGSGPWMVFRKLSDLGISSPAQSFVMIDEHEQSINDGQLAVDMTGYPNNPRTSKFVDFPADRHDNGATLSFADGHVEQWIWQDERTQLRRTNRPSPLNVTSPFNLDLFRLQSVTTRKQK